MTIAPPATGPFANVVRWLDANILALGREMRLSYLPPLMVYAAAGISGLTGIVGTFYVKERLGLSAEFLAALGFWMMLPWALKMPLGHLVDLVWRWKGLLVYLGAGLITLSLLIMIGLLGHLDAMRAVASVETWYVTSAMLAPIGYVVQDVVADAMTVEAVPRMDAEWQPLEPENRKSMHVTMQTLGRVAIISGGVLVSLMNVFLLSGVGELPEAQKAEAYLFVYELALIIPVVSVAGVLFASWLRRRDMARLTAKGHSRLESQAMLGIHSDPPPVNWWILGGGFAFTVVSLSVGLSRIPGGEEIIFVISMAIVLFLMWRLTGELEPGARNVLVGTAILIFIFRAIPGPGPGSTWWMIDDSGIRSAVPCRFVTDWGNTDACRNVHFPPLHGGALDCLYHWLAHRSWNAAVAAHDRHVLWPASLDRFRYRRCRGCAIYRRNRYRAGISPGPDRDDSHAGMDRQLGARKT